MADPIIRDPDASRLDKVRWYIGETGYVVGGLAGLALLVVGILTLAGVVDGWFLPVLGATIVGVGVGVGAQAGMAPAVVSRSQMRLDLEDDADQPVGDLTAAIDRQNALADDLVAAAVRLDGVSEQAPGLAEPLLAGTRVAHLAAVDLLEAKDALTGLLGHDDPVKRTVVADAHARTHAAVEELSALLEVLGPGVVSERAERQQQALDELSALTDWVAHRQEALRTLTEGAGERATGEG